MVAREKSSVCQLEIDIARDYKLAPVLDDNTNYIDWCKELDVWVKLTRLPEEKKALAIFLSLRGKAKKAALQLEIKDLLR